MGAALIWFKLFWSFFKIGLFGFGGGYGMISLIQNEVVEKQAWISNSEFTDIVAVSQMTPGPIGINSATYVGFKAIENAGMTRTQAVLGSLLASFSVMLPSFIIMLLISAFFMRYQNHPSVRTVLAWLRPVVVGMLAAAVLLLLNEENLGSFKTDKLQFYVSIALFASAFAVTYVWRVNPIKVILLSGLFGGLFYSLLPA
ncbi:MAG TPA: chromate transporter [Bacteroidaceae bacterium]|jgi:chromate transporter|nr:chromate transporter [Bacteroidaceae bacterium]OPZ47832.1 MAG: Chromate transport protein [Bacteroidetes bacterium ADurb.BinA104]MBP8602222.1 chromate transporter [Bacteroidaceae bacterium]HOD68140.1 chromate transporter [Bacteroidaceae bacterium]HPX98810.1 chromate transporter [Bacteroidaceae bacterium]